MRLSVVARVLVSAAGVLALVGIAACTSGEDAGQTATPRPDAEATAQQQAATSSVPTTPQPAQTQPTAPPPPPLAAPIQGPFIGKWQAVAVLIFDADARQFRQSPLIETTILSSTRTGRDAWLRQGT
jgi:hypothetical protein